MKRCTLFLIFFVISSSLCFSQVNTSKKTSNIYYVSNSGNDENNGSKLAPWKTIEKANKALANDSNGGFLLPGDKILFKAGDQFHGNLLINRSGSKERPIEISSYSLGEKPVISGSGNIEGGDYFEAIKITNASHILVTNLSVKNNRKNTSRYSWGSEISYGIHLVANKWGGVMKDLTFRNLIVSDVYGVNLPEVFNDLKVTGIRISSEANEDQKEVGIHDVLIEDCYFTHISKAGVWAVHKGNTDPDDDTVNRNQNIVVRNNTFYQTGGSGVILSKTYNGLIENNDFDHTGYSNIEEPRLIGRGSGAWVWSCRNIIAQFNRSYSVRGYADSYSMHIDFGNKNVIFQYNYSEDTEGGFCEILGDNINSTYRFNVSVNDGFRRNGSSIWVSDFAGKNARIKSDYNYIYNNTIFLDKNITPDIKIKARNTFIYNNIFTALNGEIAANTDITIENGSKLSLSNNLYHGNINDQFILLDENTLLADPYFKGDSEINKNAFKILPESPVINKGMMFSEPLFPMAGSGIFEHISEFASTDTFNNEVDLKAYAPNIGASNEHNSNLVLGLHPVSDTKNIFKIYPNPVTRQINFQMNTEVKPEIIEIFDIQGKLIHDISPNKYYTSISLPDSIKNGIYFLKMASGKAIQTSQFVLYR
ncbi:T9SS type A sorting domain-containing protein [Lutimonas saemankumensis]|uniref:T9SS type A sorting domain-containing protein n=1 Tax=Lutimonas saemankumensis TaxID=483016 RepID=UPI001CD559A7|nr:T9SS type A sorting domain-containing protein [Lutimonas saemankumensis]MCA0932475.1 T9SS type A sorting domain-containing protein [Lutimonas saemankumensis]